MYVFTGFYGSGIYNFAAAVDFQIDKRYIIHWLFVLQSDKYNEF